MLDGLGRQPAFVIVYKNPLGHLLIPVGASAVEIFVHFGDEFHVFHQIWGIALKNRPSAHPAAVTFQVALIPIGPNLLEVRAEGMAG
jgi:hypothetical protein